MYIVRCTLYIVRVQSTMYIVHSIALLLYLLTRYESRECKLRRYAAHAHAYFCVELVRCTTMYEVRVYLFVHRNQVPPYSDTGTMYIVQVHTCAHVYLYRVSHIPSQYVIPRTSYLVRGTKYIYICTSMYVCARSY